MQFIQNILSANQILTASLLSWFIAQVLKTIINFVLLGKFQLERMWGDGGMPSAHSATVCAMAIVTGRSAGISSPIFAVACVVAIITMHDAMGVRHETGEQAKVLNQMIAQWIDVSEKNAPMNIGHRENARERISEPAADCADFFGPEFCIFCASASIADRVSHTSSSRDWLLSS